MSTFLLSVPWKIRIRVAWVISKGCARLQSFPARRFGQLRKASAFSGPTSLNFGILRQYMLRLIGSDD